MQSVTEFKPTRYFATVRFSDGRECIVFPSSKKTQTYATIDEAEKRLVRWGRMNLRAGTACVQGRVKLGDNIVLTVAL